MTGLGGEPRMVKAGVVEDRSST
jgi:hypothetical protein